MRAGSAKGPTSISIESEPVKEIQTNNTVTVMKKEKEWKPEAGRKNIGPHLLTRNRN
jgi:hypothetical protein